jgi:hypothetical protein
MFGLPKKSRPSPASPMGSVGRSKVCNQIIKQVQNLLVPSRILFGFCLANTAVIFHPSQAEGTVSIKEIVSTWQKTRVQQISCELEVDQTSWVKKVFPDSAPKGDLGGELGPGVGPGGLGPENLIFTTEVDPNEPSSTTMRYVLRRHMDFGMRITGVDVEEDDNVVGDRGISIRPGTAELEGMSEVTISKAGHTLIQSQNRTIALLYWLDPLATKLCTRISRLSDGNLTVVNDPELGPIVQVALRENSGASRVVLAKNYDWRIVTLSRSGSNSTKLAFEYGRDPAGNLALNTLITTEIWSKQPDHPAVIEEISITNCVWNCDPSDLEISLPNNSRIFDTTGGNRQVYFIRNDGSIRQTTGEEMILATEAGTFKELVNSDEGEQFGKAAPNRTSMWIMIAGAVFICAAIALMIKRLR